jgi:cytochrome oxidase Cu insertion factor (SCO1/SenC/PrrC family)
MQVPSSKRTARFGLIAAALLLGICLAVLVSSSPPELPMFASTTPVPATKSLELASGKLDGTLQDVFGQTFDLSTLRGRTSVLYFASIDSLDAVRTADELNALAKLYPDNDAFRIVTLNQDVGTGKPHDQLSVRVHAKMTGWQFPTLIDVDARVARQFSVEQTGQFVVIDPLGTLVYRGPFQTTAANGQSRPAVQEAVRQAMLAKHTAGSELLALQRQPS